jgi:hemolysin activation/secretion protein
MIKNCFYVLRTAVVFVLLIQSVSAHAATSTVDAGSLLRQNEQEFKRSPAWVVPPIQPPKTSPAPPSSPNDANVWVNRFQFVGNSLLTDEQLSEALADYVNRSLTFGQLKEASNEVMNAYRLAGWTARAFLPRQEIADGIVKIQIVEAVFGKAVLQGDAPQRVDPQRLLDITRATLPVGEAIRTDRVDRAILLMDDLPGVSVTGQLAPGEQDGETQLIIQATDDALFSGSVSLDNQGSLSTGSDRLSANLNWNSPARQGDLLSLNALETQGSQYVRMAYTWPVGHTGWRTGLHASHLNYRIIAGSLVSLDPSGIATTEGWDVSYPLLRRPFTNLNLALSYDHKYFENVSNSQTSTYAINTYSATLSANQIDSWAGGGINSETVTVTSGESSNDGRYTKLYVSANRLQNLTPELTLVLSASIQSTQQNLDSSEKIYLGGSTGVRGYPASEAGGSEAKTFTMELKKKIQSTVTLSAFYDYGWIQVNHDNNISSPANPNSYALEAYGMAVAWQVKPNLDVKATVAQRMGTNPVAGNYSGNDSDGTHTLTRYWLSVNFAF